MGKGAKECGCTTPKPQLLAENTNTPVLKRALGTRPPVTPSTKMPKRKKSETSGSAFSKDFLGKKGGGVSEPLSLPPTKATRDFSPSMDNLIDGLSTAAAAVHDELIPNSRCCKNHICCSTLSHNVIVASTVAIATVMFLSLVYKFFRLCNRSRNS